jgi:hypothetical protein
MRDLGPPQGRARLQLVRNLVAGHSPGPEQDLQRCLGRHSVPAGAVGVQVDEQLTIRVPLRQTMCGEYGQHRLSDPGHAVDHEDRPRGACTTVLGQSREQPPELGRATGEIGYATGQVVAPDPRALRAGRYRAVGGLLQARRPRPGMLRRREAAPGVAPADHFPLDLRPGLATGPKTRGDERLHELHPRQPVQRLPVEDARRGTRWQEVHRPVRRRGLPTKHSQPPKGRLAGPESEPVQHGHEFRGAADALWRHRRLRFVGTHRDLL